MEKIDSVMLGLCTKVSHSFQRLTGQTNYLIAKVGLSATFASLVISVLNYYKQVLLRPSTFFSVVGAFIVALILNLWLNQMDREIKLTSFSKEAVKSNFKVENPNQRAVLLIVTIFFFLTSSIPSVLESPSKFLEALHEAYLPGLLVFVYFASVEPLPPGKSKVRMWFEKLGFFAKPLGAES